MMRKPLPIESSTPVVSHDSSVYSNDAGGIRDEHQIEKIQPHNDQHKATIRSADPIINDDRADNHLLRAFCDDTSNKVDKGNDSLEPKWFQPPDAVVQQPQMHFGTASSNYSKNTEGPNTEQQNQMILEFQKPIRVLQKQMQSLLEIHLQQQLQRLLNEEAVRRMQEKITQESAVKQTEVMRTQPGMDEIGIVSMDNSPPLPASNEVNTLDGPESLPPPTLQRIPKRAEGSKVVIHETKQLSSNLRVQMCNDAQKHSIAYIRKNSTLHPCKECGKEFTQKSNMNRHLRIHTGEKPFKCGQCNKAFNHLTTLTDHQRIHTGARPFTCQTCKASFNQKSILSRHILIHTNEKPFLCNICQRCFRTKGNLSSHMRIHKVFIDSEYSRKLHTEDEE